MSFNKVILLGNLTRDPTLRYLPSNVAVTDFGLAINRKWKDKGGEQREEVVFVDCSAFGKPAEAIHKYLVKGRPILIDGRLKLDTWTDRDGGKRSKLLVVVESFTFINDGQRRGDATPQEAGGAHRAAEPDGPDVPASVSALASAPMPAPDFGPIPDDEIPF